MKNTVTASLDFYFKGKRLTPSITLELDDHMRATGRVPQLYRLIARENNIDLYSYEYEMMQAEPIKFHNAQGLVADYISDSTLDMEKFEAAWQEEQLLEKLLQLARQHMQITDFTQHPELKSALLAAYKAGKSST